MTRVSIITPVKAGTDEDVAWLYEAIESVKAQTYTDWEMIIVNDGSDVPLKGIRAQVADDRISALRNSDYGVAQARNKAADKAQGELLLPLDHDDILPPNALKSMVQAWDEAGKDFGVVYGNVETFGPDYTRNMAMPPYLFQTLLRTLIMPIGSLHAKASWEEIGGWDPAFQSGLEDWEYWIRMGIHGYWGHKIDMVTYRYRRHSHGRLARLRAEEGAFAAAAEAIRKKHIDYYNGKEPKMCRGCGSGRPHARAQSGGASVAAARATAASAPGEGRLMVKYMGSRGAAFGVAGPSSTWRYQVMGGRGSQVIGPDGRPGIHPADAQFFKNYDGGHTFIVESPS